MVQWELIEPLDEGSIYARFLAEKGAGVHHVGVAVPDFHGTVAAQAERENGVLLGGDFRGISFAYLATERDIGVITEIFSGAPGEGQQPDATYSGLSRAVGSGRMTPLTVRDATIEVFRACGLTMFANPGSTEMPLLADLPPDLGSCWGSTKAPSSGSPPAGRSAGTSRPSPSSTRPPASETRSAPSRLRASTVRRSSCSSGSRTGATSPRAVPRGQPQGLAGDYPVWVDQPVSPQDLPGAVARACHAATTAGAGAGDRADGRLEPSRRRTRR